MKKPMRKQTMVRMLAIILIVMMLFSMVLSILVSAFAEESTAPRDSYEINIHYMEDEQALQITQRLVYHNRTDFDLDRVVFSAAANMFRRETALVYESDVLTSVFPEGYAPAGIDLKSVRVNGAEADWGYQGTEELGLRVACSLAPGESCTFEFEYFLLLSRNCAMLGEYDTDVRLSGFYFAPGLINEVYQEFVVNAPVQHTRWLITNPADYAVTLTLPDLYLPAATGSETLVSTENHLSTWTFRAENVREFALSFGKRYRETTLTTDSGVAIRLLSNHRGDAGALRSAAEAISLYESWLGEFPMDQIDLVQSDYPLDALNFPGAVWLSETLFNSKKQMTQTLRFCLAQQYIGLRAYPEPVQDAWLSDVPCSYLALLAVEETEGYNAFVAALNEQVLGALRITLPGGLYITADASLFTADEYALIVRDRGAVVMHELRLAMGRDEFIAGLRAFYETGLTNPLPGEQDFVAAFNAVTGSNWEAFLTDWLFNVDDYVDQQIDHYE